jgi:hypothetical protein
VEQAGVVEKLWCDVELECKFVSLLEQAKWAVRLWRSGYQGFGKYIKSIGIRFQYAGDLALTSVHRLLVLLSVCCLCLCFVNSGV